MQTEDHSDSSDQLTRVTYASAEEVAKLPRPSDSPPTAVLAAGHGAPEVKGEPFGADWEYLNPDASLEASATVNWPASVHRRGRTVFEFPTAAQPFWVEAYVYRAINPTTGAPVNPATGDEAERPEYEFRYMHGSESEDSIVIGSESVTIDALPTDMYPVEYVVVFASWYILNTDPEFDPQVDDLGGYVTASWGFHFVNE